MRITNIFWALVISTASIFGGDKHYRGIVNYFTDVAKGNIPGETIVNKFASNPEVTAATDPETVWSGGGTYDFCPYTAQVMEAISTSVTDRGNMAPLRGVRGPP